MPYAPAVTEHAPGPEVAVAVRGVSKKFDLPHEQVHTLKERVLHPLRRNGHERLKALTDISFEVGRGEFFGIAGRNGSGKSTLMKCLAGIYRADEGEMWLRGRMAPFIELGVGFNPDLTARDNVVINAIMLGLTPAQARERYEAIVAFAELEDFVDLKLKNYSSGMHVRLAFSVMVHVDADVLLIDEVLAVGDAAFQQKCQDALQAAKDQGRTIVLVTHDMHALQRFCDRAVLIENGDMVMVGSARDVARRYDLVNFQRAQPAAGVSAPQHGDGAATILDTWFEDANGQRTEVLEHNQPCAVRMRVEFHAAVEDPIFGVVITDAQHRMLFATASSMVCRSGSFRAGQRVDVSTRFENVLASGRHHASPQVAYAGTGQQIMDLRENSASVVVIGAREGAGSFDLPYSVAIEPSETGRSSEAHAVAR
jgi:ABC-type polysaccharide/polyol phosphate transport system ATPase subunit